MCLYIFFLQLLVRRIVPLTSYGSCAIEMSIIIINNSPESNLLVFSVSQPNHQAPFHIISLGCNNNQKATLLSSPISQVPRLFYSLCLQYNTSPERNRVGFSVFPKFPGLIIRHCSTSLVCGVIIPRKQPCCLLRFPKSPGCFRTCACGETTHHKATPLASLPPPPPPAPKFPG